MNLKKIAFISASMLLPYGCDNINPTNNKSDIPPSGDKTEVLVKQGGIEVLNIISNKPEDDQAEKELYTKVHKELSNASEKRNNLLDHNNKLTSNIAYIPYTYLISLIIKESRLHFLSNEKASGYGQLEQGAIDHVTTMLNGAGITTTYNPKTNHEDNLLYMLLYFGYLTKEIEHMFPNIQKEDRFLFALGSYNGGKNKIGFLYEKVGSPTTREEFADKVTHDLMDIKEKPKYITDPTYNVPGYKDHFGDITKYNEDKTVIASGTYNENTIIATQEKTYRIIRYVEIIKAIHNFLKKK